MAAWYKSLGGTIGTDSDILFTRFTLPIGSGTDTDGDGLTDDEETNQYGTDPNDSDSDDDGMTDGDMLRKRKSA